MKKKILPVVIAVVLIIVIAVGAFGAQIIDKYSYSKEYYDMTVYFENKSDSDIAIIMQDSFMSERAYLYDGCYYVELDFVSEYLDDIYYYDENENLLIYTLPLSMIVTEVGSSECIEDGVTRALAYEASRMEDGKLLVALDYVKEHANFSYEAFENPGRIQIYTKWDAYKSATVKRKTSVRHRGGIKEEILKDLVPGDKLIVIEQMDEWSKVKTNDAIIGFVENKCLDDVIEELAIPVTDYQQPEYSTQCRDYKINMGWHAVAGVSGNDTLDSVISKTKGLNVISPTWFGLLDVEGNMNDFSSLAYVDKAHSKGLEVWPTFNNTDSGYDVDLKELFSYTQKRQKIISNLISVLEACNADGINVDIEMLPVEAGKDFSEFIRELSIECRKHELVLSIDNYVPIGNTDYYDRTTQGQVADYVVIMGYDEHYASSQEAGSVASIGYVETGITNTLKEVPASKIINGIPFYSRIWETQGADVKSTAVDMAAQNKWISDHNVTMNWDEKTCQNYGEFTSQGKLYQIWQEDADSIKVKLSVMDKYNVAGVAQWRLGYETSEIWDVIEEYLNK